MRCSTRWRSRANPALPYIMRLMSLMRVTRSIWVKVILTLAPGFGIRGYSSLEPMPYCSFAAPKLTGNLFDRTTLLAQVNCLLIARISLGSADCNGPGDVPSWVRAPFFHGDSCLVNHDRPKRSAAPKREVVQAQTLHILSLRSGQRHHPAHNRHPGCKSKN